MEDLYKDYARIYDIIYYKEPLYRKAADYIEKVGHRTEMDILDLCGGTGSHANLLIGDGHHVTIVDQSPYMLDVARNKNSAIRIIESDIFTYVPDTAYDMILCMYGAIHYTEELDKIQRLIALLRKHLKPGGKVLFELRFSDKLPEQNGLEMNNGWWNRKFFKRKKGINGSDLYVVTAFNREEHFLDIHNLYHCDPFLYRDMFQEAGFTKISLYDDYTETAFDPIMSKDVVVLVAEP